MSMTPESVEAATTESVAAPDPVPSSTTLGAKEHRMSLLNEVPVHLAVNLGRTQMRLAEVLELHIGQVIELDRQVGAPVDVVANDKVVIARGEVVEVDDEYGIRITEVVAAEED
jgi:flagellar motor switch protein FliN/FliY